MKKLIYSFSMLAVFSLASNHLNAQNYQTALGLRLGYPLSVSLKHFISGSNALEAYVGSRWYNRYRWTNVSLAYLIHMPIEGVDELNWYVGGGGTLYFWNFDTGFGDGADNTSFGIQGYIGLEYTFDEAPINLSLDWIPTIFINGYGSGFGGGYGSFAVRYILSR